MRQSSSDNNMNRLKYLSRKIEDAESVVAGVCLIASTSLIFLAAVVRSFSRPINWSLDISLFLFAWAVFFSADVAYRDNKLVNLDFFLAKLSDNMRRFLSLVIHLIILVFLLALVYYGIILAYKTRQRAFQGIPNFSYSYITMSLPVGALLLLRSTAENILALFSKDGGQRCL